MMGKSRVTGGGAHAIKPLTAGREQPDFTMIRAAAPCDNAWRLRQGAGHGR